MNHSELVHNYILDKKIVSTVQVVNDVPLERVIVLKVLSNLRNRGFIRKMDNGFWIDAL